MTPIIYSSYEQKLHQKTYSFAGLLKSIEFVSASSFKDTLAEWPKAPISSTSLYPRSQVRTLQVSLFVCTRGGIGIHAPLKPES